MTGRSTAWALRLLRALALGLLLALAVAFPQALAAPFAYIANSAGNSVSVIDTATNTVTATIPIPVGTNPKSVAVHPDGTRVYVTNASLGSLHGTVSVIDTFSSSVIATIDVGDTPDGIAISPDGSRIYVANSGDNSVSVIDTTTYQIVVTLINTLGKNVFATPVGITVSLDGAWVYVTQFTGSSVALISATTNPPSTSVSTIAVGAQPYQLATSPTGAKLYVGNQADGTISVIDTSTNTVSATIPNAAGIVGLATNNAGTRLYAAVTAGVLVVDTATNGVVTTVPLGNIPQGIAVDPTDSRVYVARNGINSVTVIETVNNTVVGSPITVGSGPTALAFGRFQFPAKLNSLPPKVVAGANYSLALKSDGSVDGWGANLSGQLGLGTIVDRHFPGQAQAQVGAASFKDIAAGESHAVAVNFDGSIWGWGSNSRGQLATGLATANLTSPTQIVAPPASPFIAVAAGRLHTLALRSDGTVWAWGANDSGQLGVNTNVPHTTPVQVMGQNGVGFLTGITAIAAGDGFSLAIGAGGGVFAWGANNSGQLGDNSAATSRSTPVRVQNLAGITGIAAGSSHALALRFDGTVWSWGANASGQLGFGTSDALSHPAPVQIAALSGVRAISAGGDHSAATLGDFSVMLWGANSSGELGNDTLTMATAPIPVAGFGNANVIAVGIANTLVLRLDGSVWAAGRNDHGQVGDNTIVNRVAPTRVIGTGGIGFLYVADTVPDPFPAQLRLGVPLNTVVTFTPITVTGINAPTPVSSDVGFLAISINGGPFLAGGVQTVTNGQTVTARINSGDTGSNCSPLLAHLTIGGIVATFEAVTAPITFMGAQLQCFAGALTSVDQISAVACGSTSHPTSACASLADSSFDMGSQTVGVSSAVLAVPLTNSGPNSLTGIGIATSGDFGATTTCGTTLGVGGGCTINIAFTPSVTGNRVGGVTVSSNVGQGPLSISLTGTGVAAVTTTSINSSLNPSPLGAGVTFTATISGGSSPTGTVQFMDNGTPLGLPVPVSASQAQLATSALAAGTHIISAAYSGDTNNAGSTSSGFAQTVNQTVQRAFVSATGNNANTATFCAVTAPCKTFAAAVTVVADNGEVVALNTAPYGSVTLTRSISLTAAPGAYAGISVFAGSGVTIATPNISVVLRGLTINGQGGANGILVDTPATGAKLSIENCVIANFANPGGAGVLVNSSAQLRVVNTLIRDSFDGLSIAGGATAVITNSKILENSDTGILVNGASAAIVNTVSSASGTGIATGAGSATQIAVTGSAITNNGTGVSAQGTSTVTVSNSMVTGNTLGLSQADTSTLELTGNNTVRQNATPSSGTITTAPRM